MIRKLAIVLVMVLMTLTLTACGDTETAQQRQIQSQLTIEVGAYGYDSAVATNTSTGEVLELGKEVMQTNLNNPWWWLIGISVRITSEDIFYNHELTKGERTYHLVANNTLKTFIEDREGWDVEVTMGKHKVYG